MENNLKRRTFIKNSSAGIAGLSLGVGFANEKMTTTAYDVNGVHLAIATICLDGFGDDYFKNAFEVIPKTGLKNVEFNVWHPRTVTPQGIESIRERCYINGLKPISLQGSSFGGNVLKDVTHKLWLMEQAKSLGCRIVKFTGAGRGKDGGLESVIETLKHLANPAEDMDIIIAVENHANNNIENIEDYDRIFEAVDSSHIGMCLDMGHFDGANVDNFEVVERFHEKVLHIDIKDTQEKGIHKVVPYGQGVTKGEEIVKAMIEKGYTGYIVIEQAPPIEGIDLTQEIIRIKNIFSKFTSY